MASSTAIRLARTKKQKICNRIWRWCRMAWECSVCMAGMGQWAYNMGPPGQGGIYICMGDTREHSLTLAHTRSHSHLSWAHPFMGPSVHPGPPNVRRLTVHLAIWAIASDMDVHRAFSLPAKPRESEDGGRESCHSGPNEQIPSWHLSNPGVQQRLNQQHLRAVVSFPLLWPLSPDASPPPHLFTRCSS